MRLPGKDKLNGPRFVIDESQYTFLIRQQQVPALVPGDTTCKTDRQRRRIEHRARSLNVVSRFARGRAPLCRAVPNKRDEPFLETHMSVPQFFIRNTRDRLGPNVLIANSRVPIVAGVILNEMT